jgi:hypothetical protein
MSNHFYFFFTFPWNVVAENQNLRKVNSSSNPRSMVGLLSPCFAVECSQIRLFVPGYATDTPHPTAVRTSRIFFFYLRFLGRICFARSLNRLWPFTHASRPTAESDGLTHSSGATQRIQYDISNAWYRNSQRIWVTSDRWFSNAKPAHEKVIFSISTVKPKWCTFCSIY